MSEPSIWRRRGELDRERREFMRTAMADFDAAHRLKIAALQEECGKAGHRWRFTDTGPTGLPWFMCLQCHRSEVREDEK